MPESLSSLNPFAAEVKRILNGGMTQEAFAKNAGVSQAIVSAWASGKKLPSPSRVCKLVEMGVSFDAYEQACLDKIRRRRSDISSPSPLTV